jgi:hypothetical protein
MGLRISVFGEYGEKSGTVIDILLGRYSPQPRPTQVVLEPTF